MKLKICLLIMKRKKAQYLRMGGNEDAMKSFITHWKFYIFCALEGFLNRDI